MKTVNDIVQTSTTEGEKLLRDMQYATAHQHTFDVVVEWEYLEQDSESGNWRRTEVLKATHKEAIRVMCSTCCEVKEL